VQLCGDMDEEEGNDSPDLLKIFQVVDSVH
jgi:hypothetical protein